MDNTIDPRPADPQMCRPFWQTEPCPPWCDFKDDHADDDAVEDRTHYSRWEARMPLSLVDITLTGRQHGRTKPEYAYVSVRQHYREVAPIVWLGQSYSNRGWFLTSGEARRIADELIKGADLADGHWGGE